MLRSGTGRSLVRPLHHALQTPTRVSDLRQNAHIHFSNATSKVPIRVTCDVAEGDTGGGGKHPDNELILLSQRVRHVNGELSRKSSGYRIYQGDRDTSQTCTSTYVYQGKRNQPCAAS